MPIQHETDIAVVANEISQDIAATRTKRDVRYAPVMPFVFGMLHFGYGLGSLWGVVKCLGNKLFWGKILLQRCKVEHA